MLEFDVVFYLMPTSRNDVLEELGLEISVDWSVSHGRCLRAIIIIWGMHYSSLEARF